MKQQLAAIRHLFDGLITSQVVPLDPAETRTLLDGIDVTTPSGLREGGGRLRAES